MYSRAKNKRTNSIPNKDPQIIPGTRLPSLIDNFFLKIKQNNNTGIEANIDRSPT